MSTIPVEQALIHARAMSPFSGDGMVAHVLADEIDRLRALVALLDRRAHGV